MCGSPQLLYGTVCVVSADNPASCLLGGFKESTSAHLPCRQCLGTRNLNFEKLSLFSALLKLMKSNFEHWKILKRIFTHDLQNMVSIVGEQALACSSLFHIWAPVYLDVLHRKYIVSQFVRV